MDGTRFDAKVRAFSTRHTRQGLLKILVGSIAGGLGVLPTLARSKGRAVPQSLAGDVHHGIILGNVPGGCRDVAYREIDGYAITEGDIIIGTVEEVAARPATCGDRRIKLDSVGVSPRVFIDAVAIEGDSFRWPLGIIPYKIDARVSSSMANTIEKGLLLWRQAGTPVRLVPWDVAEAHVNNVAQHDIDLKHYVVFKSTSEYTCSSDVGRQSGPQTILLGPDCDEGNVLHELGHAAGLYHEHQRPDRDDWVTIVWENLVDDEDVRENYEGLGLADIAELDSPYDYGSIMHYPADANSKNGNTTIRTPHGEVIGQRDRLSVGDVAALEQMYPCPPACVCVSADPNAMCAPTRYACDALCQRGDFARFPLNRCAEICYQCRDLEKKFCLFGAVGDSKGIGCCDRGLTCGADQCVH